MIFEKHVLRKKKEYAFPELFPLFKGPGRALPSTWLEKVILEITLH